MGNSVVSKIEVKVKVILNWTFRKELTLNDVLYVLDIRKNLNFRSILSKMGFTMDFELDKFVLTKRRVYVGKVILLIAF